MSNIFEYHDDSYYEGDGAFSLLPVYDKLNISPYELNEKFSFFSEKEETVEKEENFNNLTNRETGETEKSQSKDYRKKAIIKKLQKSEIIFDIKKISRKLGRLKNNCKIKKFIVSHDKFADDNIIRKIKGKFLKYLEDYLNVLYSDYIGIKSSKLILQIDPSVSRNMNPKYNLEWFDKKIKDVFSYKISPKFKKFNANENIIRIRQFYEKEKNNPIKLIQILEMKIRDIYNIYIKDEKEEGFEEFINLNCNKKYLESEMHKKNEDKIKEYLEKYDFFAKNLEKKFKIKSKRSYNKRKMIK